MSAREWRKGKPWMLRWPGPGIGKFTKRAWHKAERMFIREHGGKERCVRGRMTECNYKTY